MSDILNIAGRIHSISEEGIVTTASEIKDEGVNKRQSTINAEVQSELGNQSAAIDALENQNYVNISATNSDTTIEDVFTRLGITPSADTIYRVANWKYDATTKYNTSYFSEYSVNISGSTVTYVPLMVVNLGIDEAPVAGSDNLVQSGGVAALVTNNLTTSDSTKVLSAAQGKVIADATMKLIEGNILDPSTIIAGKVVQRSNGKEVSLSGYSCTPYIEITEDGLVANHVAKQYGSYVCGVCIYGEDMDSDYVIYSSPVHDGDAFVVNPTDHPTWKYARFNLKGAPEGEGYAVYRQLTLPTPSYQPYFQPYWKMKEVDTEDIVDKAVTIDKLHDTVEQYITDNILNPETCTFSTGYYISSVNGSVAHTSVSSYANGYTDYVPIDSRGITFNKFYKGGTSIGGAVYYVDNGGIKHFKRGNIGTASLDTCVVEYDAGDPTLPDTDPMHYPDAFVRFTIHTNGNAQNVMVNIGTTLKSYVPYGGTKTTIDPNILPPLDMSDTDFVSKANNNAIFTDAIDMFLPDKLYAVRGDVLQLFFQGMAKVVNPENYNYFVESNVGAQYHRLFEYNCPLTATLGNKTLTVRIKDNNRNVLAAKSTTIGVVDVPTSPSSNINVLCIGDSITAGGVWVAEFERRLKGTGGTPSGNTLSNITFVGKMLVRDVHFEAHSGWAWRDYTTAGRGGAAFRFYLSGGDVALGSVYSNNGHNYTIEEIQEIEGVLTILCSAASSSDTPSASGTLTKVSGNGDSTLTFTSATQDSQNPFWDDVNQEMTFIPYANTYCNGTIDVVYVLLGSNRLFYDQENDVKDFLDTLHTDFPSAKVKLMGMYVPSMKLMMPGYTTTAYYSDTYNVLGRIKDQCKMYQQLANTDAYSSFVEYLDVACQLDSDYNMPITQKNVNTRNSSYQEPYANNTIHASPTSGYLQIADAAYRNFVANFCQ